jgi:hypothetical protein
LSQRRKRDALIEIRRWFGVAGGRSRPAAERSATRDRDTRAWHSKVRRVTRRGVEIGRWRRSEENAIPAMAVWQRFERCVASCRDGPSRRALCGAAGSANHIQDHTRRNSASAVESSRLFRGPFRVSTCASPGDHSLTASARAIGAGVGIEPAYTALQAAALSLFS